MDISYVQGDHLLPDPIQGEESDVEEEAISTRKRKTLTGPGPETEVSSERAGPSSKKQKTTDAPTPSIRLI